MAIDYTINWVWTRVGFLPIGFEYLGWKIYENIWATFEDIEPNWQFVGNFRGIFCAIFGRFWWFMSDLWAISGRLRSHKKNCPEIAQISLRYRPENAQKLPRNRPGIAQESPRNRPEIAQKSPRKRPEIVQKSPRNRPEIVQKLPRNRSKISQKFVWKTPHNGDYVKSNMLLKATCCLPHKILDKVAFLKNFHWKFGLF